MVRRTSGKTFYIKQHIGPAASLAAIVPCIKASSPSEAVVGQHNMHDGLCSGHVEAVMITQSEAIYSAQVSHHGEALSSSR